MTREALEKFHESFIETHSSPSRLKFMYQFGASPDGLTSSPGRTKLESPRYAGPPVETTNQLMFRQPSKLAFFAPETKHNYMKAPSCVQAPCSPG
jgi:hypothetical protein